MSRGSGGSESSDDSGPDDDMDDNPEAPFAPSPEEPAPALDPEAPREEPRLPSPAPGHGERGPPPAAPVLDAATCLTMEPSSVDDVSAALPFDLKNGYVVPREGQGSALPLGRVRVVGFGFMATTCRRHSQCACKVDCQGDSYQRMLAKSMLWLIAGTTMDSSSHSRAAADIAAARRAEMRAARSG